MRIWSKALIPYLPTKQLKAMRYELGDMVKQYPNIKHGLVKFANDYDCIYLFDYFFEVNEECAKRKMNMSERYNNKIYEIASEKSCSTYYRFNGYTFSEDTNRYLKQCLYNLQEKYDRGIVTPQEWQLIYDNFAEYLD